jgi:tetratricopeptide (TPR) repeat protein
MRALRLLCLGFALATALPAAAPAQPAARGSTEELEAEALTHFAAGRYAEALELYAKLYSRTLHLTYLRNVARCHQFLGHADKAIASFREYLRRGRDLSAAQRAEVEGFIHEMEELEKRSAPVPAPAPTRRPPPALPVISTAPALEPRRARTLGLFVRGDFGVQRPGAVVAAGLSFTVHPDIELGAAVLLGSYVGGWLGGQLSFGQSALRPLVSVGLPLFRADGKLYPGAQLGAGLRWQAHRYLAASVTLSAAYFPGADADLRRLWVIPSAGLSTYF